MDCIMGSFVPNCERGYAVGIGEGVDVADRRIKSESEEDGALVGEKLTTETGEIVPLDPWYAVCGTDVGYVVGYSVYPGVGSYVGAKEEAPEGAKVGASVGEGSW